MKSKNLLFVLLFPVLLFTSCVGWMDEGITGNGNVESEIREVGNFHGIEAASGLNVFVEFGEMSNDIEVVADENLLEYIITEVDDGMLKIKSRKNIRRAS
ncbi:MAG: GIN domain-containing protein, partial [Bacteroidales bacterium]